MFKVNADGQPGPGAYEQDMLKHHPPQYTYIPLKTKPYSFGNKLKT